MLNNFFHFLKYNNGTVIILAVILILGGTVFASEPGREAIGEAQTRIEGVDNSALLAADLANFNLDFKIDKIEADDRFYYVTYGYLDLALVNQGWQYQLREKTRKISKKLKSDLGLYLAEELKEESDARLKILSQEQAQARQIGPAARVAITEYSGLIGKTLDLAKNVFPGYEPVKRVVLAAPEFNLITPLNPPLSGGREAPPSQGGVTTGADNLTQIYNDYVAEHDQDSDGVLDAADNCPNLANADQLDSNNNGLGDVCDIGAAENNNPADNSAAASQAADNNPAETNIDSGAGDNNGNAANPEKVEIIEPPAEPAPEPAPESTPAPEPTENAAPAPTAIPETAQ